MVSGYSVLALLVLSHIWADFLCVRFQQSISSRQANGLTVTASWLIRRWLVCVCVRARVSVCVCWLLVYWCHSEFYLSNFLHKSSLRNQSGAPPLVCGLITQSDSGANQQCACWNAHACNLTNGIKHNCLQISKLMDMSISTGAGEMSQLTGKIWTECWVLFFQKTMRCMRWWASTDKKSACLLEHSKSTGDQRNVTAGVVKWKLSEKHIIFKYPSFLFHIVIFWASWCLRFPSRPIKISSGQGNFVLVDTALRLCCSKILNHIACRKNSNTVKDKAKAFRNLASPNTYCTVLSLATTKLNIHFLCQHSDTIEVSGIMPTATEQYTLVCLQILSLGLCQQFSLGCLSTKQIILLSNHISVIFSKAD